MKSIGAGVQVATAFATNCDDVERISLLKEPVPETKQADGHSQEQTTGDFMEEDDPGVRVSQANTGQLGPASRTKLLDITAMHDRIQGSKCFTLIDLP